MLLFLVWTYDGRPLDVGSANRTADIRGTTGRKVLFEIPHG
jgi:hypothetical protein